MSVRALLGVLAVAGTIGVLPVTSIAATPSATTTAATPPAASPPAESPRAESPPPVRPRASLPTIERRVMCVTCKIPLIVAESTQADRERAFIRGLIAEGRTETQIERALVGQYGPAALALPRASGFDLTAYLVPLAAVLALAATLVLLLPRWRRRARAQSDRAAPPELTVTDTARLDADLARFDR